MLLLLPVLLLLLIMVMLLLCVWSFRPSSPVRLPHLKSLFVCLWW
jgi:hypothetical protein